MGREREKRLALQFAKAVSGWTTHPKVKRLARALSCSVVEARGYVATLRDYAALHAERGNLDGKLEDATIFCDYPGTADEFFGALMAANLVDPTATGHELHGWLELHGRTFRDRERARERMREYRERKRNGQASDAPVTRNTPVTTPNVRGSDAEVLGERRGEESRGTTEEPPSGETDGAPHQPPARPSHQGRRRQPKKPKPSKASPEGQAAKRLLDLHHELYTEHRGEPPVQAKPRATVNHLKRLLKVVSESDLAEHLRRCFKLAADGDDWVAQGLNLKRLTAENILEHVRSRTRSPAQYDPAKALADEVMRGASSC